MALVIETRSSHGSVSRTHLRAGTTRVVVRPGDTFRLYDEDTGKAPAKAVVKQLDNSILVDNLADGAHGADQPQAVELLGFYSSCSVSSPCHLELPETTSGTVDITPATGAIGALSDGSFVLVDLAQTSGAAAGAAATKGAGGCHPRSRSGRRSCRRIRPPAVRIGPPGDLWPGRRSRAGSGTGWRGRRWWRGR